MKLLIIRIPDIAASIQLTLFARWILGLGFFISWSCSSRYGGLRAIQSQWLDYSRDADQLLEGKFQTGDRLAKLRGEVYQFSRRCPFLANRSCRIWRCWIDEHCWSWQSILTRLWWEAYIATRFSRRNSLWGYSWCPSFCHFRLL